VLRDGGQHQCEHQNRRDGFQRPDEQAAEQSGPVNQPREGGQVFALLVLRRADLPAFEALIGTDLVPVVPRD